MVFRDAYSHYVGFRDAYSHYVGFRDAYSHYVVFRAAGHEFHAEHLQPGGRDAQAQTTEAGEEAPTVPLQGNRAA